MRPMLSRTRSRAKGRLVPARYRGRAKAEVPERVGRCGTAHPFRRHAAPTCRARLRTPKPLDGDGHREPARRRAYRTPLVAARVVVRARANESPRGPLRSARPIRRWPVRSRRPIDAAGRARARALRWSRRVVALFPHPVAALAPALGDEADPTDRDAALHTLDHVVNGQPRDPHRGHRLHLDPGLRGRGRLGPDSAGCSRRRSGQIVTLDRSRQRMTKRVSRSSARRPDGRALRRPRRRLGAAVDDETQRLVRHRHERLRDRSTGRDGLVGHIDHPRATNRSTWVSRRRSARGAGPRLVFGSIRRRG